MRDGSPQPFAPPSADLVTHYTSWRGRRAVRLTNGLLDMTVLTGGGHVADLRLSGHEVNPLWVPHWDTIEPENYDPARHWQFGQEEGRLLGSIAGHVLCLNHFGGLSEAELEAGGYEHGEAANLPWQIIERGAEANAVSIAYGLELPEAGMRFLRKVTMRRGEPVAHFEEAVTNLRRSDSPLAYQQHVTLGAPFVEPGVTRLDLPGVQAQTFPASFGAADPLTSDQSFIWPEAPGAGALDVFPERQPLCSVCTVAVEESGSTGFVAISNPRLGLLLAYVFPADVFNWASLWYENGGITDLPYDGRTTAWGIEFGTCALPVGRIEMLEAGPLFGRRRFGVLPALQTLHTEYDVILHPIPPDWQGVADISRQPAASPSRPAGFRIVERGLGREITIGVEQ